MSLIRQLALLFAMMGMIGLMSAQVVQQPVPQASSGTITAKKGIIEAGEQVPLLINLDNPPLSDLQVMAQFQGPTDNFTAVGTLPKGKSQIVITVSVPSDADGGIYKLNSLIQWPPAKHDSVTIQLQETQLQVHGKTRTVPLLPSKATGEIQYDQKQFIRKQAEPLQTLLDNFFDEADKSAVETDALLSDLIDTLNAAAALLPDVEKGYIRLYKTQPTNPPVIFEDYRRRYEAQVTPLKALRYENQRKATSTNNVSSEPKLLFVHQKLSRRPNGAPSGASTHHLAGTFPALVNDAIALLEENIRAYQLIGKTGVDTFSIRLASRPTKALIFYKRAGEDYQELSKQTDVQSAIFPYALWTFKFQRDGCKSIERRPDPYIEGSLDLEVELSCHDK